MAESTSEQKGAAATMSAKETPDRTAARDVELNIISKVIVIDDDLNVTEERDGDFDLDVTPQGAVKGKHTNPSQHNVTGNFHGRIIRLDSEDGARTHVGILIGNTFIGLRRVPEDQEEGIWVGTKNP